MVRGWLATKKVATRVFLGGPKVKVDLSKLAFELCLLASVDKRRDVRIIHCTLPKGVVWFLSVVCF